ECVASDGRRLPAYGPALVRKSIDGVAYRCDSPRCTEWHGFAAFLQGERNGIERRGTPPFSQVAPQGFSLLVQRIGRFCGEAQDPGRFRRGHGLDAWWLFDNNVRVRAANAEGTDSCAPGMARCCPVLKNIVNKKGTV